MKKKIVMLFLLIGVILLQVSNVKAQVNNKKEMANVVVFVKFKSDTRDIFNAKYTSGVLTYDNWQTIKNMYNESIGQNSDNSFKKYIETISEGKLSVENYFPQESMDSTSVNCYTLDNDLAYYLGSDTIVQEVINAINTNKIAFDLNGKKLDNVNSGVIDNLTVIVQGTTDSKASVIYPHRQQYSGSEKINGLRVSNYNILPSGSIVTDDASLGAKQAQGVIAHEFLHVLGFPDLYRSSGNGEPVGLWDVMAKNSLFLQYPLSYLRAKQGWVDMEYIDKSGNYTLTAVSESGGNKVFAMKTPLADSEYIILEYRKKNSSNYYAFEHAIPSSGLLMYRVNEKVEDYTNIKGDNYLYVYRPDVSDRELGADLNSSGYNKVYDAALEPDKGETEYGSTDLSLDYTHNTLYYSDGSNSGIKISNAKLSSNKNEINFNVEFADYSTQDLWESLGTIDSNNFGNPILYKDQETNDIYLIYSTGGVSNSKTVIKKWDGSNWISVGNEIQNAIFSSFAKYKDEIYIVCESTTTRYPTYYKLSNNTWKKLGEVQIASLQGIKLVESDNALYLMYEEPVSGFTTKLVVKDILNNQIIFEKQAQNFGNPSLYSYNNKLYLAYSNYFSSNSNGLIESYDLTTKKWETEVKTSLMRTNAHIIKEYNNKLYALVGASGSSPSVYIYDGESWTENKITQMTNYINPSMNIINDNVYVSYINTKDDKSYVVKLSNKTSEIYDDKLGSGYSYLYNVNDKDNMYAIAVLKNSTTLVAKKKVIEKEKINPQYKAKVEIDYPSVGKIEKNTLNFQGWVMSNDKDSTIEVYIDGVKQNTNIERYEREDVLSAIKGYGGKTINPKPGYRGSIDISTLTDGNHKFTVVVKSSTSEELIRKENTFAVKDYTGQVEIDQPLNHTTVKTKLDFQGWVMSEDKESTVEIYLDDIKVNTTIERYEREDVINAIKGYGGRSTNPKPGYRGSLDISSLKDGEHRITIKNISKTGAEIASKTSIFHVAKYNSKMEIDYPYVGQIAKNKLNFQGWVMSEAKNQIIEVYIDGVKQTATIERYEREDVLNAIKGYGGRSFNLKPGYQGSLDISGLQGGEHRFMIIVKSDTDDELVRKESSFLVKNYEGQVEIDKPLNGSKSKESLSFQGWEMSEDKNSQVEIYIDQTKMNAKIERYEREDVIRAIKGYGGKTTNSKPGYRGVIDISTVGDGEHTFTVKVLSETGEEITNKTVTFLVKKYDSKVEIDTPFNTTYNKKNIELKGWVMSEDSNAELEVYIDNIKKDVVIKREKREDVLAAYKNQYGGSSNKTPGYRGEIDYQTLTEGNHEIRVKLISSKTKEVLGEMVRSFFVNKYNTKIEIDSPLYQQTKKTSIDVKGWIMSEDANGEIRIYLDGNKVDIPVERYEREDVIEVVKGYGDSTTNPKPGYRLTIDSNQMLDGKHTLRVDFVSSENPEKITSLANEFKIKKYDCKLELDNPRLGHINSSIIIKGWELSELDDSYIKVYMDKKDMNISFTRVERQDVLDAYNGAYGGESTTPFPGFEGELDISNIKTGTHTLTFKVFSKLGEVIASHENTICIRSCPPVYYNQADPRWATVIYGLSTMKGTGCAPTSMAMAFSAVLGRTVLPTDVASYLYYNTDQFNTVMKGTSGLGIHYASNHFGVKYDAITSKEMLIGVLKTGRIVYGAMANGKFATPFYNHAILLHGYNNGNTMAYDPLKTENNEYVSIDQVWNEQSKKYDDYRGGSNFYSLESYY